MYQMLRKKDIIYARKVSSGTFSLNLIHCARIHKGYSYSFLVDNNLPFTAVYIVKLLNFNYISAAFGGSFRFKFYQIKEILLYEMFPVQYKGGD